MKLFNKAQQALNKIRHKTKPLPQKTAHNKAQGHAIEQSIARWLTQQGATLITQNFYCKGGEIDLIALSPDKKTLLFIEVKYSQNERYGKPYERVNLKKQQRLIHCAHYFLATHPHYQQHPMRFDVISQTGNQTPIWLQNAFQTS